MLDLIYQLDDFIVSIDVENDLIYKEKILRFVFMDVLILREKRDVKVVFLDFSLSGKVEFCVICYYVKQFDVFWKKCCGGDLDYICLMSRCRKWGVYGGKSNVFFVKIMDD